jgi:iron complex transport system substrate-binding protein
MLRRLSILFVTLALLAACGGQPAAQSPTSAPAAVEPTVAPASDGATSDGASRIVTHALGEAQVPAAPQRIAALDHVFVANLISLGITPRGKPSDSVPWFEIYGELVPDSIDLNAVPSVGLQYEPNIEALAAINPDLILISDYMEEEVYTQASQIAPTVVLEWINNGAWQQRFDRIAAAVGRETEAEAVRQRYQQVIDGLPEAARTARVAFVRPDSDGQFRLDSTEEAFPGSVAIGAGVPLVAPEGVGEVAEGSGFVTISGELLTVLEEADLIVVADWSMLFDEEPGLTYFERNPLWERLPAVQAGRVLVLPGPIYNGGDYMAAELLLRAIGDAVGAPAATSPATDAAFPVMIEHKYGTTAIPQQPERVVSVGFNDQDAILALGVVPVGIRDWYGEQPNATWLWAQDELGGATTEVLPSNELNFEQIAALNPDLIIGISSGMSEQDYATLSQIAPTVAQSAAFIDYGVPWQEQTRVIGTALGRSAQAETLVAEVEALFADARTQHPAFAGASAVVAVNFNNQYAAYGPQDVRGRLLTSLGFALPQEIVDLAGDSFFTSISNERLDLIDTDVLVIAVSTEAERAVIESDPLYQQLNAVQQGRVVFLDQELSGAASFSSVLSLPYLLERFVPKLAAAVDGDPATAVP